MSFSARVILVRPRNPFNIGACARAMANFGVLDLWVVDPYGPIWQETQSAPGAEKLILDAHVVDSWDKAIVGCDLVLGTSSFHQRPAKHAVVLLPDLQRYLYKRSPKRLALVFGSERAGLSNAELSRCHAVIQIPTERKTPSMNLAHAVAVTLYELRRTLSEPRPTALEPGDPGMDVLIKSLMTLSERLDLPTGYTPAKRMGHIRHVMQDVALPSGAIRFFLRLLKRAAQKRYPHST